jgi:MFS family permease
VVVMQVGAAIGFITFGYIADVIGRRKAFMLFFVGAAAIVPVYSMAKSPQMLLILGPLVAYLGTGFYSGFAPTFAELFPTSVRATAQGFIYNTGRAASAVAPAIVGLVAGKSGVGSALALTSGFFLLAALLVFFFIPETRGAELE